MAARVSTRFMSTGTAVMATEAQPEIAPRAEQGVSTKS